MNKKFLAEMIESKFGGVSKFASALELSAGAVYKWISGETTPSDQNLFEIVSALELEEAEIDRLMGIPETVVSFRNKSGQPTDQQTTSRAKELADGFFKLGDSYSYVVRDSFPMSDDTNPLAAAGQLRALFGHRDEEPLLLVDLLIGLRKHNISAFFLPFERLGLHRSASTDVAFSARQGQKVIIFLDTARTLDELTFDLCHELAHVLMRGTRRPDNENEGICDLIAEELVYPSNFFLLKKAAVESIIDESSSPEQFMATFLDLGKSFDWSAKGLAKALLKHRLLKETSTGYARLMLIDRKMQESRKSIDDLHYSSFRPNDFDALKQFFSDQLHKGLVFMTPFIELKNAAACGRLSARKLADLLLIDSGDADELIRVWRKEIPVAAV